MSQGSLEALVVISHLPNGQLMTLSPTATRTQPDRRERVCSVTVKVADNAYGEHKQTCTLSKARNGRQRPDIRHQIGRLGREHSLPG